MLINKSQVLPGVERREGNNYIVAYPPSEHSVWPSPSVSMWLAAIRPRFHATTFGKCTVVLCDKC